MDYLMPTSTRDIDMMPSTIETIDAGFYDWVNDSLNISVTTNKGWEKVPVLWLTAERAFQIKNNKELRDSVGKLRLPLVTVNRTSIVKDPRFKGGMQAHFPPDSQYPGDYKGGVIPIARRIGQRKTRDFANKDFRRKIKGIGKDGNPEYTGRHDNAKVVYETMTIPVPTHITLMYSIILRSEYQQQMNTMLTPFITRTGGINGFYFEKDTHKYEGFIQQDFSDSHNLTNLAEDERKFETKVEVKVLGYLIGEGPNDPRPKVTIRENAVEFRISRERVILGDSRPWAKDDGKYRE